MVNDIDEYEKVIGIILELTKAFDIVLIPNYLNKLDNLNNK